MLKVQKLIKNINFNYKMSEEPIKTLWQADNNFTNLRQHKMNPTIYFETFKPTEKVIEELNQSTTGQAVVDILCWEQNISDNGLGNAEKTQLFVAGQERILGMQLVMNTNRDKYGTLNKDYNREYLSRNNKYPKTLQGAYNLLKR